ncbi:MAG: D-glycero-beta-D-manno-heptose 1-phosphate adenylyltransferase [Ignavibacteria bacterium]|nr:D-glycero-beta-D-manno-heptose 1-phosphate adenylyltransferase [Ignavibacteria bacterium]
MILTLKEFQKIRQDIKEKNLELVFTNGCFEILHRGHIAYLNEAKTLGDFLIVGLNSDRSVKKLKGSNRPYNNENDRAFVLDNLKSVDYIILFSEDTPYDLIKNVKPDYLVKGGDWKEEEIVGSEIVKEYGGKVISLKYIDNYSTTSLINKIKET